MRKATGTPVFESGKWWAKITLGDGSRCLVDLTRFPADKYTPKRGADGKLKIPESIRVACCARSEYERATGKLLADKRAAQAAGVARPRPTGETVDAYAKAWLQTREAAAVDVRTQRHPMG